MKILRISHIGVAPNDFNNSTQFFINILGLNMISEETIPDQEVFTKIFQCEKSRVELLSPTNKSSPIAKFLESRKSGIHHVAFEVDNIEEWLIYLKNNKIQLIDETPRIGAHQTKIIFIHPRATGGILVELVEELK